MGIFSRLFGQKETKKSVSSDVQLEAVVKMPDVPEFRIRTHFTRKRVATGLFVFYAVAIPVYLYFGFQPSGVSAAYAEEVRSATGNLQIPSISLSAPISEVKLDGRVLIAPDYIVGRYHAHENKTFVMGHSSTVFSGLKEVMIGDEIIYDGESYEVVSKEIRAKSEISMREILKDETVPTLVLMTCAGEHIEGQDYSHRLIIYAN